MIQQAMRSRRFIPQGFDERFGSIFSVQKDLERTRTERGQGFAVTRWRDALGRVLVLPVSTTPANVVMAPNAYGTAIVGQGVAPSGGRKHHHIPHRHHARRHRAGAPHHGGGGGHHGGGHHGFGRGRLGPGGWDYWGDFGYPLYEVDVCPDGTFLLPDGTCAALADLDTHTGCATMGVCEGEPVDESLLHSIGAPMTLASRVGASGDVRPYDNPYGTSGFPTSSQSGMPAAGSSGTSATGDPDVDALAAQFTLIDQSIHDSAHSAAPSDMVAAWSRDDGAWQGYVADFQRSNVLTQTAMKASLDAWQRIAVDWANAVRAQWPAYTPPASLISGQASPIGLYPSEPAAPSGGLNIPGLGSFIGWTVVAVAVAAGVWLFWPVIAKHALAFRGGL